MTTCVDTPLYYAVLQSFVAHPAVSCRESSRCPHRNDCVCHRKRGRIQRLPAFKVKHDIECRITVNNDVILMEDFDDFHAT